MSAEKDNQFPIQEVGEDTRAMMRIHNEELKLELQAMQDNLANKDEQISHLQREIREIVKKHDTIYHQLQEQIQIMQAILTQKGEQIADLQREIRERNELERVNRYHLEILEEIVPRVYHLPYQIQEVMEERGVRVMEILGFAKEFRRAITNKMAALYSEPFLTVCGAQLQVKVLLNGAEGDGEPCMTVFIVIMKGPNDNYLDWPFRGLFSLHIYNPEMSDFEFIDSLESDPNHFSFQRPNGSKNVGCGFRKSIRHTELIRMVREDKLVIKVLVDAAVN